MNLAGILFSKTVPYVFFLSSFLVVPTNGQTQEVKLPEDSFSMEFPPEHSAPLSEVAKKALASDRAVADVMRDERISIDTIPKDWFRASVVHLGPRTQSDLVVMGLGISLGPYSARFWVLRQTLQGYDLVLAIDTHDLELLQTRTNGLRDIETGLTTLSGRFTDIYRFDGQRYQKREPTEEKPTSRIPNGEAQFSPEQLKDYYRVYENADVRYLRTLFDAYLADSGGTEQERNSLDKWNKEYFRSKFTVLSRENNMFGGTLITILFQDRADKVFVAWVYPEGSNRKLALKGFDVGDFSEEDIRRIKVRYKKLIEDKGHAM